MTRRRVTRESETVPGHVSASGLAPYGIAGARTHAIARAPEMRRDLARQLLGAQPIDEQGQVRAVLLDGAQREDDERPLIAGQAGGLAIRALGETDQPIS